MSHSQQYTIENSTILDLLDSHSLGVNYICSVANENPLSWQVNYIANSVEELTGNCASHYINNTTDTIEECIHPLDIQNVQQIHSTAVSNNDPWEVEFRIKHRDGSIKWIVENGKVTYDQSGELRIVAYLFDNTERKTKEIREAQLNQISKEIIFGTDLKVVLQNILEILLTVFDCDRAWLLTPLDPKSEEYDVQIMRTTEEFFLPEGLTIPMDEQTAELMQITLDSPEPVRFYTSQEPKVPTLLTEAFQIKSQLITSIQPKIGSNMMFGMHHCRTEKIWSSDELYFFNKISTRITETLNSFLFSEELNRTQSHLSNIFNSMPSTLIGVTRDQIITHWNREAEKSFSIQRTDAIGKQLFTIIPRLKAEKEAISLAVSSKVEQKCVNREYKKDGETHYENITIYPVIANEEIDEIIIRIDDITKEYELEEQLNQSRKMEAIGQLAGGIAHDFNNMLGGIVGAAEMLKFDMDQFTTEDQEFIRIILNSATKAADLTSKLLTFGRKRNTVFTTECVHQIISDSVGLLNRTINKNIKIEVHSRAEQSSIIADCSAIQNCFLNLAINASHAMHDGGMITFITENVVLSDTYCTKSSFDITPGNYIKIGIYDTGEGISENILAKIFEPFFTTKEVGKGTGLGLAAVYGTIQEHFGEITVSTSVGKGTKFNIHLPSTVTGISEINEHPLPPTGTGRILLVDDEDIILITGKSFLVKMGYTVSVCNNPHTALDLFTNSAEPFDLVITDLIMPEMSGAELFLELQKIDPACKVLIASGFTKEQSLEKLKECGDVDFVQKPFTYSQLGSIVDESMKA